MIDGATVVITDIETTNGIIHVIDAVILPASATAPTMDIVETAIANGNYTTLVTAVQAAGLVDDLQSAGPFTVFAPTDSAFAALPAGTIDALLADTAALASILRYHVVNGAVTAEQVVTLTSALTLNGSSVTISVNNGVVKIDEATVIITDIKTTNGIIHVIDAVIIPGSSTLSAKTSTLKATS